jgi:hypothetical protein
MEFLYKNPPPQDKEMTQRLALVFVCFGLFIIFFGWKTFEEIKDHQTWLETTGQVIAVSIHEEHSRYANGWCPKWLYGYQDLNGNKYISDRATLAGASCDATLEQAQQRTQLLPVGGTVTVHYDPKRPSSSTLFMNEFPMLGLWLFGALSLICFGFAFITYLSSRKMKPNELS